MDQAGVVLAVMITLYESGAFTVVTIANVGVAMGVGVDVAVDVGVDVGTDVDAIKPVHLRLAIATIKVTAADFDEW